MADELNASSPLADTITQLIAQLDSDLTTRTQVKAELLALEADIVAPLLDVLRTETGRRAFAVTEILGDLHDERAIPALSELLRTDNSLLGSGAVVALCKYPHLDIIPILLDALPHANLMTQQSIVMALQKRYDPRVVKDLVQRLHAATSPTLRTAIIKALIALGDASVLDDILRYADDANHHVREWAQEAKTRFS